MKKPRFELSRWAPPGMELRFWKQFFWSGLFFSALYSMTFLMEFKSEWNGLWADVEKKILWNNARMPAFFELLDKSLFGYLVLSVGMVVMAVYSYGYFYRDSRSIYLMRGLPDRWELHRRCLPLPAVGILICTVTSLVNGMIYYGIYRLFTPVECLPAGLW